MKPFAIALACAAAAVPVLVAGPAGAQVHGDHVVVTHRTMTHRVVNHQAYHRPIAHRTQHCSYRWVNHHRVRRCWHG